MAHSESKAWLTVVKLAKSIARSENATQRSLLATDIERIADRMLDQLQNGMHENPGLVVWGNPPEKFAGRIDALQTRRLYEVRYKHAEDGKDYRHEFKAAAQLFTVKLDDGMRALLVVSKDGKPLWDDF